MSSGSSASFFLIVCFLVCSSEGHENITTELGQDVTLTCKADNNKTISAVEWNQAGLDPEYVFYYRDGHLDLQYQDPSYKNRVDLKDREVKDGDVSLVLKNVTMEDRDFSLVLKNVKMKDKGRYECRVFQGEIGGTKIDLICIFNLKVLPPGDKDGGDKDGGAKDGRVEDGGHKDVNTGDGGNTAGIIAGSVVGVLILLLAVGLVVFYKKKKSHSTVPPDEAAAEQMF